MRPSQGGNHQEAEAGYQAGSSSEPGLVSAPSGHRAIEQAGVVQVQKGRRGKVPEAPLAVHVLDRGMLTWSRMRPQGDIPPARGGHTVSEFSITFAFYLARGQYWQAILLVSHIDSTILHFPHQQPNHSIQRMGALQPAQLPPFLSLCPLAVHVLGRLADLGASRVGCSSCSGGPHGES